MVPEERCWDGTAGACRIALAENVGCGTGELINKAYILTSHVKLLRNNEDPGAPASFLGYQNSAHGRVFPCVCRIGATQGINDTARAGGCGVFLEPGRRRCKLSMFTGTR